jgi:hypothetical protein
MILTAAVLALVQVAATPPPRKMSGGFGRPATTQSARVVIGQDDIRARPTPAPEPFVPGLTRPPVPSATSPQATTPPAAAAPVPPDDETAWRSRYAAAKAKLATALEELRRAEDSTPSVVSFGRPGPLHWLAVQQRDNVLLPYRMAVDAAAKEVRDVVEECRRTVGCAPGWCRD